MLLLNVKASFFINTSKFRLLVCLLSYTLLLTPTPNGLDYSGLSTLHARIAWAYLEIANTSVNLWLTIPNK